MRREPELRTFLAHLPLFQGLSGPEIERLAAGATRRRLRRGETLFRQGEPPAGMYAVVHGRIALTARSKAGRERVTEIVGDGRSFGEAVMFLDKPTIVGARALSDALVLRFGKESVFAELERDPRFARRIIAGLAAKLHATVSELDSYALGSGAQRFVAWLLRLAQPQEDGSAATVLPAAKKAIASRLNLSAEHLSRILRQLATEELIEVRGRRIGIPNPARLREWSERA